MKLRYAYADNGPLWKVETSDGAIRFVTPQLEGCSLCRDTTMNPVHLATVTEVFVESDGYRDDYDRPTPVVICLPCYGRIGTVISAAREALAKEGVTA